MSDLVCRLRRFSASEKELLAMTKDAADEIERLRAALEEIAQDPTGVSIVQAEIAKAALSNQQKTDASK